MATVSVDELHDLAEALATREEAAGTRVTRHLHISKEMALDLGTRRLTSIYFARPEFLSLLTITQNGSPPPHAWISFAGADASHLPADAGLFQYLLHKGPQYEWGGPFVASMPRGITFGMKYTIPSDLIGDDDDSFREGATFIFEMILMQGRLARMLANEVVPTYGGRLLQDNEDDHLNFYTALHIP